MWNQQSVFIKVIVEKVEMDAIEEKKASHNSEFKSDRETNMYIGSANEKSGYLLQEILFPRNLVAESLYVRFITGFSEFRDDSLKMNKGAKVSFNTYFNSFYESFWWEITTVDELFLEVVFSGSIIVEVYRDTKTNGCSRIVFSKLDADAESLQHLSLPALLQALGETGRLFVDIIALKKSSIRGLRFKTNRCPVRKSRISIGICTFNREKFLLRSLRAILDLPGVEEIVEKIIVVNQGRRFVLLGLADLTSGSDRIFLIEQGNLGGCGGFTRTMYEAMKLNGVSHHVLMDDDAVIDARVLQNLQALLSYTHNDVVVGGQMLDLLRPNFLYEAGAVVGRNTRLKSLHHNVDLRAVDSLIPFNKYYSVDYNAWWFCAIPVEQVKQAEYPAPIFIRGDDMEYGIRLQERGVKTVAMPGIAVWHEPFYVKVGGWQTYYDLRNRLILASTYPHRFKHEAPLDVLWWMLKAAASHDYLTATLLAKAVQDFLQGPSLFEKGADDIHAEISKFAKTLAQPSVPESELPGRPARLRRMPKSDVGLGLLVVARIFQILLFAKKSDAVMLMDHEANISNIGARPYVKTNGVGSYRLRFEPDRAKLLRALKDSFAAWLAYLSKRRSAAEAWSKQVPELRSAEAWERIFEADASRREKSG